MSRQPEDEPVLVLLLILLAVVLVGSLLSALVWKTWPWSGIVAGVVLIVAAANAWRKR